MIKLFSSLPLHKMLTDGATCIMTGLILRARIITVCASCMVAHIFYLIFKKESQYLRVKVKIDIKDSMTIEHRPHPQKEPSLITGSIHEVDGKIIDWVKYPYFQEHNGYKECPLTLKQIENALKWAWSMQDKYHGTARIILNWFGEMTPEAMKKLSAYPEVSPHYDFIKNPDMDMTEESNRRKSEMTRKWKQGRRNGTLKE